MNHLQTGANSCDVAVVIPLFKAQSFIVKTLDHLFAQTVLPREVFIVDDESPDDSYNIVQEYLAAKEPLPFHVEVIRQKNGGPAKARNSGIRRAKSKFIAFLDQDDFWNPNKLEECWRTLENLSEKYVGVYHRFTLLYPDGHEEMGRFREGNDDLYEDLLKNGSKIANSSVIVRRSSIEKVGFLDENPRLIAAEDFDLWLRLSAIGEFLELKQILMKYTADVGFSWRSFNRQQLNYASTMRKHAANPSKPLSLSFRAGLLMKALRLELKIRTKDAIHYDALKQAAIKFSNSLR